MWTTPLDIVTLVKPVQLLNASCMRVVTLAGIVMLVSTLQEENAESPMLVTGLPAMLAGISIPPRRRGRVSMRHAGAQPG